MSESNEQIGIEDSLPGIVAELGNLQPKSVIFEEGMSHLFGRHTASIKRAVDRGELPPPARMFGKNAWTVESITDHISRRLGNAAKEREAFEEKVRKLNP
jgi:hypothetical protein